MQQGRSNLGLQQGGYHLLPLILDRSPEDRLPCAAVPVLRVPLVALFAVQQCVHPCTFPVVAVLCLRMGGIPVAVCGVP